MPNNMLRLLEGETSLRPPLLQAGRVINVNHHNHTYDVETDNNYRLIDLPAMYPYVSNEYGQGINFIAEAGTRCLVCNTANGEDFIMGWLVPVGTASSKILIDNNLKDFNEIDQKNADSYPGRSGKRPADLLPGDLDLSTASGSKIRILNGNVIEIVAEDGTCFTKYIAITGKAEVITKADIINTVLGSGSFNWSTDNKNRTGNLKFSLKSDIDQGPDVSIEAGYIEGDDSARVIIKVGNADSPNSKITISKEGELAIECKDVNINSKKNAKINCKNATINASSRVKISSNRIELN